MPSKPKSFTRKYCGHIRLAVFTLIGLSLAAVMLWALVAVYDPQATLLELKLNATDSQTLYLDIELSNPNYFRGFNFTQGGWFDVYYVSPYVDWWELNYRSTPTEYQGFRKTLRWNVTMPVSIADFYVNALKSGVSHINVILHLTYKYKILFWTTQTSYYQWLDTDVYLANGFDTKNVTQFGLTQKFILALG